MGVSGVVSADEALFRLTAKVGASPGLLATLVKALIADVRRLDAKVDALEAGHGGQLRDMKLNLDILVSNIQGYDDPEEEVEREKAERAAMREDLERDKAERAAQVAQRRADLERDKADCAKEVEARRIEFEREQAARLAALAVVEREAAARAAALEQQRSTRALWREKSESATEMERNRKSQQDFDKRAQEDLDRRARDLDAAAQEAFDVSAQEELALLGPMARRIVRREAGGFLARNPGARPPHHAAVFPAARDADAVAPAAFLEALGALGFEVSAEERAELLAFYAVEPGGKVRGREFMLHFHQATWHQLSQKEQAAEVLGRLRDPVVAAVLRAAGIEALTADDADAAHHEADAGARKRWQAVAEWWPEARLLRPEAAPADTDEAAPADEAAPNAEAVARRKRVRKRWRWAFMMIKMRRLQRRIPLTKARTDRKHSLAVRLQAAEDGLDRAAFKLDQLASGASPDRFAEIERCARWCEAQLAGGGQGAAGGETARGAVRGNALGAVERLGRLEASMRAADESARKADEAASALAGDCAALRLDVRAARDSSDAACEAAAAAALRIALSPQLARGLGAAYGLEGADEESKLLLRFVRARKLQVDAAHAFLAHDFEWRLGAGAIGLRTQSLADALGTITPRKFSEFYERRLVGLDGDERPVFYQNYRRLIVRDLKKVYDLDKLERFHAWEQERAVSLVDELGRRGRNVSGKMAVVLDVGDMTIRKHVNSDFINVLKKLAGLDSNHFPERMGVTFVINAPGTFPMVWRMVRGFIDPVTAAKIFVLTEEEWRTVVAAELGAAVVEAIDEGVNLDPEFAAETAGGEAVPAAAVADALLERLDRQAGSPRGVDGGP
eukprot:CAMPEP_0184198840 /NCGR_PEP_ID=MMETSP0976-20121227/6722_1 /TAXON_ID=483370 /ORGANISM="non described non described, Strain CCMP2097" /LENGTH=852 /DNA_ID=CAMNT_0026503327 /DNA_START=27 /DNA_END=2581 /DNA_ORIENTATION=+